MINLRGAFQILRFESRALSSSCSMKLSRKLNELGSEWQSIEGDLQEDLVRIFVLRGLCWSACLGDYLRDVLEMM